MLRFRRYRLLAAISLLGVIVLYSLRASPSSWRFEWKTKPSNPPLDGIPAEYANREPGWHRNPDSYGPKQLDDDGPREKAKEKSEEVKSEEEEFHEENWKGADSEEISTTPAPPGQDIMSGTTTTKPEELITVKEPEEETVNDTPLATPLIHWEQQRENFPVPPDKIIKLPTTPPLRSIPRIQFEFGPEDDDAKHTRQNRLAQVKAEMLHAWSSYRKFAWGYDELKPTSLGRYNPFCGWAATLVDALDTLWIMDMKEEFDEAVEVVDKIDFTYSASCTKIPVFETTIRYLGGLLAAYDVSGGTKTDKRYKILLDKAVELAEILMGAFDTPNRMPILYYDFRPESVVKAKLASTNAGVAEVGSLLMEFTRLAQITGQHKYYDAVARVTDALEDFTNRNPKFPGLFPEKLDISGCDFSIQVDEPKDPSRLVVPGLDDSHTKSNAGGEKTTANKANKLEKRGDYQHVGPALASNSEPIITVDDHDEARKQLLKHCRPQPIVPSMGHLQSYSIAGSQDSTYEYFPKEFILLGGREPKYKKMTLDALDATKKYLLYRPMTLSEEDILFPAKVMVSSEDKPSNYFEVTHLSCFAGGMYGLAAKVFGKEDYLDLARRLTNGCVWAYKSFPHGIMPESSLAVACQNVNNCPWNQTLWYRWLDPMGETRDENQREYDEKRRKEMEKSAADSRAVKSASQGQRQAAANADDNADAMRGDEAPERPVRLNRRQAQLVDSKDAANGDNTIHVEQQQKETDWPSSANSGSMSTNLLIGDQVVHSRAESASPDVPAYDPELDWSRPLNHKEYAERRIKEEWLAPGFVSLVERNYILRPEAIESVWYMYRLTGERQWQEKGWAMFRAIVEATRTEAGHSAIYNIASDSTPTYTDSMQSFWMAETLKYCYLLFTDPDAMSLDEWVFTTEAHPFRRPG